MAWPERPHVRSADSGLDIDDDMHALIALANAALPADDPRKITREKVRDLHATLDALERDGFGLNIAIPSLRTLAAALESYLPPE